MLKCAWYDDQVGDLSSLGAHLSFVGVVELLVISLVPY